jgi:hypothetical protein
MLLTKLVDLSEVRRLNTIRLFCLQTHTIRKPSRTSPFEGKLLNDLTAQIDYDQQS